MALLYYCNCKTDRSCCWLVFLHLGRSLFNHLFAIAIRSLSPVYCSLVLHKMFAIWSMRGSARKEQAGTWYMFLSRREIWLDKPEPWAEPKRHQQQSVNLLIRLLNDNRVIANCNCGVNIFLFCVCHITWANKQQQQTRLKFTSTWPARYSKASSVECLARNHVARIDEKFIYSLAHTGFSICVEIDDNDKNKVGLHVCGMWHGIVNVRLS